MGIQIAGPELAWLAALAIDPVPASLLRTVALGLLAHLPELFLELLLPPWGAPIAVPVAAVVGAGLGLVLQQFLRRGAAREPLKLPPDGRRRTRDEIWRSMR